MHYKKLPRLAFLRTLCLAMMLSVHEEYSEQRKISTSSKIALLFVYRGHHDLQVHCHSDEGHNLIVFVLTWSMVLSIDTNLYTPTLLFQSFHSSLPLFSPKSHLLQHHTPNDPKPPANPRTRKSPEASGTHLSRFVSSFFPER